MSARRASPLLALCLALSALACGGASTPRVLTLACAASLAPALEQAAADWTARRQAAPSAGDLELRVVSAASSTLARQIEQGAPIDLFVSASDDWMDALESAGRVLPGSRRVLARNRLVWARPTEPAPGGSPFRLPVALLADQPWAGVPVSLHTGPAMRWTTGDPAHVPLGVHARRSLEIVGAWSSWEPQLVPAADARAALRLVERGEVDLGLLYASDARGSERVEVLIEVPVQAAGEVVYPAALLVGADPAAAELLDWLASPDGGAHLVRHGLERPAGAAAAPDAAGER